MRYRSRRGFTVTEIMVALGLLGVALVLVAQVGVWALRERARMTDREAAQEMAANVLESARAVGWEELTPEWAQAQRLPEAYAERGWALEVHVAPEESRPLLKRVTVDVLWKAGTGPSQRPVELVGLFAARDSGTREGKP
jgi:prepilin-type N-terminal cleavage/methylation domain-containing protein